MQKDERKRAIGDITHPDIRNADELYIWYYRQKQWILCDRSSFPASTSDYCRICPPHHEKQIRLHRTKGDNCKTKVANWTAFKQHLASVEKEYGELVAFPTTMTADRLPNESNYLPKFRNYGDNQRYLSSDIQEIWLFDLDENRFVRRKRESIRERYFKNRVCTYCNDGCTRKVTDYPTFIKHLRRLERKFFCFLIVDELSQHDEKNQERVAEFVNYSFDLGKEQSSSDSDSEVELHSRARNDTQSGEQRKRDHSSGAHHRHKVAHHGSHHRDHHGDHHGSHSAHHSSYGSHHGTHRSSHHDATHSGHSDHRSKHDGRSHGEQEVKGFVIKDIDSFVGKPGCSLHLMDDLDDEQADSGMDVTTSSIEVTPSKLNRQATGGDRTTSASQKPKQQQVVNRDYTSSSRDHTSSKRDYSSSNRDYSSSNRDYTSSNRDHGSSNREHSSSNRDYSSSNRDYSSSNRDYSSSNWNSSYQGVSKKRNLQVACTDRTSGDALASPRSKQNQLSRYDYSPSNRDYSSSNRDYSSSNRDYNLSNRDYNPSNRDSSIRHQTDRPAGESNLQLACSSQTLVPYTASTNRSSSVLDELNEKIKQQRYELDAYLRKIEQDTAGGSNDLERSLIDEQTTLILKEKEQNCLDGGENLSFTRSVKLNDRDLSSLLEKHRIPFGFTIENAEICLNLVMKEA